MRIFCDYLDVTYAPDDCPSPDVNRLLLGLGYAVTRDTGGNVVYVPPKPYRGVLSVQHRARFARISASGGVCSHLRDSAAWDDYLHCLSTSPHKVTRLDAALDLPTDGASMIDVFRSRYPAGTASLTRKALKMDYITAVRPDGLYTGTVSFGYRSAARFTARVYDKAWEALCKRGEDLPPTTRFEVTARKDSGATLRDASMPAAIFWHIASPALLQAPSEGVPVWEPNTDYLYESKPRQFNTAETLRRCVENSAELEKLLELSADLGPTGAEYLLHRIRVRLGLADESEPDADAA